MEEEEFLGGGTRWLVTVARNSLTILLTFDEGRDQDSAAVVDHAASSETGQFPSPGSLVSLPPRSPLRSRSRGIQKLSRESNGSCFLLKVGQRQCLDDRRLSLLFQQQLPDPIQVFLPNDTRVLLFYTHEYPTIA